MSKESILATMNSSTYFLNIEYLKKGNIKQKRAYEVLTNNSIMESLTDYDPVLVGTIPISIDTDNSDLDIACHFSVHKQFKEDIISKFGDRENFHIWQNTSFESLAIVANLIIDGFKIEIFGQNIPTTQQRGYRHMIAEHKLLQIHGEDFRKRIIELKKNGHKTEPAFAKLLELKGDPYDALLELDL